MYKIIGADQNQYGPVSAEQIVAWIGEKRVDANTMVQKEGSPEWNALSALPEFADALQGRQTTPSPTAPPCAAPATAASASDQLVARDYQLQIGKCVSRGWELLQQNFGLLFLTTLVYILIELGFWVLGQIPILGIVFSLGSLILSGPLAAGLYCVFLSRARGRSAEVGGLFSGFSNRFWQYVLAYIVPVLLLVALLVPGGALAGIGGILVNKDYAMIGGPLIALGVVLALIPSLYLGICWSFALWLVMDKPLDFWKAMELSRKMVNKHFFVIFGLFFVLGLINVVGLLVCLIGVLVTFPLLLAAMAYAYETMFGVRNQEATLEPQTPPSC